MNKKSAFIQAKFGKTKLGFSLIELSMVILVIGILVIGVTKGSRIIKEAKLKSAQALTKSSLVNSIDGLYLWLDATNKDDIATGSVGSGVYGNAGDGQLVSDWKDSNPQSSTKFILSAPNNTNRPTYVTNGIGGLPSLQFSSANTTTLLTDGFEFGYANYSIFAVFNTSLETANRAIVTFVKSANNPGLNFHIQSTGVFRTLHRSPAGTSGGNSFTTSASSVLLNKDYIVGFSRRFDGASSQVWLNNTNVINATPTLNAFESGGNRLAIGSLYGSSDFTNYFEGNISEIIIFKRALKDDEITGVTEYLSQKYGIKIS